MTDLVLYRLTSADPVDGPLITLDGVPVRAYSVELEPRYEEPRDISDRPGRRQDRESFLAGADVLRGIEVRLRVQPDAVGQVMTAYVAPARPHSGPSEGGTFHDAHANGSWLEVREDPVHPGEPVIVLDGEEFTLDKREAWTFLTEVAAILGHREEGTDA